MTAVSCCWEDTGTMQAGVFVSHRSVIGSAMAETRKGREDRTLGGSSVWTTDRFSGDGAYDAT